jgi:hypothetical protein
MFASCSLYRQSRNLLVLHSVVLGFIQLAMVFVLVRTSLTGMVEYFELPSASTVLELKVLVSKKFHIPSSEFRLQCRGHVLEDDRTLDSQQVSNLTPLLIVSDYAPGSPSPRSPHQKSYLGHTAHMFDSMLHRDATTPTTEAASTPPSSIVARQASLEDDDESHPSLDDTVQASPTAAFRASLTDNESHPSLDDAVQASPTAVLQASLTDNESHPSLDDDDQALPTAAPQASLSDNVKVFPTDALQAVLFVMMLC